MAHMHKFTYTMIVLAVQRLMQGCRNSWPGKPGTWDFCPVDDMMRTRITYSLS